VIKEKKGSRRHKQDGKGRDHVEGIERVGNGSVEEVVRKISARSDKVK